MAVTVELPSDAQIRKFNLQKLEEEVEQHKSNVKLYSQLLAEEEVRLTVAQNIVLKKKQLDAEAQKK